MRYKHLEVLNQSDSTIDVLVYGAIPSWSEDYSKLNNTSKEFVESLNELEKKYDTINIHINSPGGSIFHGMAIYNKIKSSTKNITTINDGLAASMGGVLLVAGKKAKAAKGSLLMLHAASGGFWGNSAQLKEYVQMLDTYNGLIAQHFADKIGKSKEEILEQYFDGKDHWLTAEEALELGFIDEILDYEVENSFPQNAMNMSSDELIRDFERSSKNSLSQAMASLREKLRPTPGKQKISNLNEEQMDFKQSLSLLALGTALSADQAAEIKAEIDNFLNAGEKFTGEELNAKLQPVQDALNAKSQEVESLTGQVQQLSQQVETLKKEINPFGSAGTEGEGDDETDEIVSETDLEVKKMRAALKLK